MRKKVIDFKNTAQNAMKAVFDGVEFIPQSDRDELNIQIDLAGSTPLKETNVKIAQVEKFHQLGERKRYVH